MSNLSRMLFLLGSGGTGWNAGWSGGASGGGGGGAPAWVPANAVIHIDFLGGSPQGRAWSNGAVVAINTLLGSDPNTEAAWDVTSYDPAKLTADGYGIENFPFAFIGEARTKLLAGSTTAIREISDASAHRTSFILASADGNDAIEIDVDSSDGAGSKDVHAESWGGSLSLSIASITNAGTRAVNVLASTLTTSRLDMACNGSAAVTSAVTTDDFPASLVAALLSGGETYIQSITLYDPLPTTAGLSALSAIS